MLKSLVRDAEAGGGGVMRRAEKPCDAGDGEGGGGGEGVEVPC